ncbi:methyltransferase domain-containing protein [Desulfobacterales bacterium HSG17]|nr:methyltransferase domain-containing protein [Desulfobacterales bacterium HSG17]
MNCPFCNHLELKEVIFPFPSFRHSDFKILSRSSAKIQCRNCLNIFNNQTKTVESDIKDIYKNDEYFIVKKTHYISFENSNSNENVSVYKARARFLKEYLPMRRPVLLDIGCLDGKMLLEFDQIYESAQLHGFDVNPKIESIFPRNDNFYFWSEKLSKITRQFDAIIVANVIQYIPDLNQFLSQLKKLLKPNGFVFIEITDIVTNPYVLLYGDQMIYYSETVLENIFNSSGFKFSVCKNNWANRNTAGIAVIEKVKHEYKQGAILYSSLSYFQDVKKKIEAVEHGGRIGVLGSTINAAFINFLLKGENSFFVDENISRVGDEFYGKKIMHPMQLKDSDLVILPYKETGERIKKKFVNKYRGTFICV